MELGDRQLGKRLAILVSGKAGVGKTTVSNILKKNIDSLGYSCQIVPFASGLKTVALRIGWDGKKDEKGRKLLIELGCAGRNYDLDTWAKYTYETIIKHNSLNCDIIINDDWRYPNEALYISKHPLYSYAKIRIEAPSREILKNSPHYLDSSEVSLPTVTKSTWESDTQIHDFYDYFIDNEGTMEQLELSCSAILDDIILSKMIFY